MCLLNQNIIFALLPQILKVGTNQSFSFKTQHGETYGPNTKCTVHFKVSAALIDRVPNSVSEWLLGSFVISVFFQLLLNQYSQILRRQCCLSTNTMVTKRLKCRLYRRSAPVHPWRCPAQSSISNTPRKTAKAKREISLPFLPLLGKGKGM